MNTRYIPIGAEEIIREGLNGVVYTYEVEGVPCALAYCGKRSKPSFHVRYRSIQRRDEAFHSFFKRIAAHAHLKNEWKAQNKERQDSLLKTLEVGSLFVTRWGYEQTNVEFYEVIKIKGCTVYLRRIDTELNQTGCMSGTRMPIRGKFVSPELKRMPTKTFFSAHADTFFCRHTSMSI